MLGCTKPTPKAGPAQAVESAQVSTSQGASDATTPSGSNCNSNLFSGFPDPQVAYAAYAEAINAGRWCDAINTFAPSARAEVVEANFKGLAMLSGADNPKRADYQRRFSQFCTQRRLRCGSRETTNALAQALLARQPADAELAELRALAATSPEDVYVDVMVSLASVDANAMSKFDVPLSELQVDGAHATGKAPQTNGRISPLPFVRTDSGWMLAFR